MAILKIHYYGDPILEKPTTTINNITSKEIALVEDMFETMFTAEGVGLAANQVGINKRIVVIDASRGQMKKERITIINPEIVFYSKEIDSGKEGCLSFPEMEGTVERSLLIGVRAVNLNGDTIELEVKDMLARIFQHEIDHLNGKMFIERMLRADRQLLEGKLKKLKKETLAHLKNK
ncbi:MAG: peptide deformylase [bacterium]